MENLKLAPGVPKQALGSLPYIFRKGSPERAETQIKTRYIGGYVPLKGHSIRINEDGRPELLYPGDPPREWFATWELESGETCLFFRGAYVAIVESGTELTGPVTVVNMD